MINPIRTANAVVPTSPTSTVAMVYSVTISEVGEFSSYVGADVAFCGYNPSLAPPVASEGADATGTTFTYGVPSDHCLYLFGEAQVTVVALGYLSPDGPNSMRLPPTPNLISAPRPAPGLRPLTPKRVLDTRSGLGGGKLAAHGKLVLRNLPIGSKTTAVVLNVTATEPTGPGWITVWPCDVDMPIVSNLNYDPNETIPNLVTVAIGRSQTVCLYSESSTHLIADIMATYETSGGVGVVPLTPQRILDTRDGTGAPKAKLRAGGVLTVQVAGRGGAPASGVRATTMNVTAVGGAGAGYLTVWACDRPQPTASNVNFVASTAVPNLVTTQVSAAGTICVFTNVDVDVIGDIAAVYVPGQPLGYVELAPRRILDTRTGIGAPVAQVLAGGVLKLQVAAEVVSTNVVQPTAATMNVTATGARGTGYITVWPCDRPMPVVSNLNVVAGDTVANLVSVELAVDGSICILTTTTTDLVADIAGYSTRQTVPGSVTFISDY